jgi:hypothetical protein
MTHPHRLPHLRRMLALVTVAAMLAVSCSTGEEAAPPTTVENETETAIRMRNLNIGRSFNRGFSQASGAVEGGFNDVGGGSNRSLVGGFGGSGIVIIRYPVSG